MNLRSVDGNRNAIALLMTVMFVIVISVGVAFGLKQINEASKEVKDEKFMYQSSIIIEDVLTILNTSKELKTVVDKNSSEIMFAFLAGASFIPFKSSGIDMILQLSSARSKYNPLHLHADAKDKATEQVSALKEYMNFNRVNSDYVDVLMDCLGGIKEDNSYNSAIFDENPYLFRDYLASKKHLQDVNDYYAKEYNDNSVNKIEFDSLFYFTKDANASIDVNYATMQTWEMMLGVDKEQATLLNAGGGGYSKIDDLELNSQEQERLSKFKTSFFEPYILIDIEISKNGSNSKISFEYDVKNKKGSNFVYEI